MLDIVRWMPICSSRSSVGRMPAVSRNRKSTPPMLAHSSITSRVVPAISETMARSSFRSRLSSVDLPTFGAPAMATATPSRMALPSANELRRRSISAAMRCIVARSAVRSANSTSSSEKSSSSSSSEVRFSSFSRSDSSSSEYPPRICVEASACAARDDEAIMSATASACERSSFPAR